MSVFKDIIATQVLEVENPIEKLDEIGSIFLKNNLPVVGKIFSVFQI